MEKFYIVKNEKLISESNAYAKNLETRNEFITDFFERFGIDGKKYNVMGSGFINHPFDDEDKKEICLYIEDTEKNREKFSKDFKQCKYTGVCEFKKSSKVLKAFQQECVDKKIIINLYKPEVGCYFKEFEFGGYRSHFFKYEDKYYLRIEDVKSNSLDSITPIADGFEEIKGSEFYRILEQMNDKQSHSSTK